MPRRGMCRASSPANQQVMRGPWTAALFTAAATVFAGSSFGWAQGSFPVNPTPTRPATRVSYTPDQTKNIIDDLSNGFMDDFSRRVPVGGANPAAVRGTPTNEIRLLKPLIREFSDEVSQLGYELNDELRRLPTIRPLLTDALTVSALAVTLDRLVQTNNDHNLIMNELRKLNASWRELSYRLGNVRGLSRATTDRVTSLNLISDDIEKSIGINPQFKRQDLLEKSYSLAQDLRNLTEDVQADLGPREAQGFLLSLNRARQVILNIASMLEQTNVDSELIVSEYKRFQSLWYPERVKLQAYNNSYLERSLRRITQTDGEIHQLLLLPTKVDSQQLIYLTSALRKDIDQFFDRTSLKLLMSMPQASRVPGVASEFYGVCEHFIDEVQSNASRDQLIDSFRYIEDAQYNFSDVFHNVPSNEALAALQQIEQTIATLSSALQVSRDTFDRQGAIDLLSGVESEISQLEYAASTWLSRDRQPFANACLQSIRTMRQQAAQLNSELVRGGDTQQYGRQAEELYNTWRTVYNYLIKCQTADRSNLGRISSRITPALVELRTLLAI